MSSKSLSISLDTSLDFDEFPSHLLRSFVIERKGESFGAPRRFMESRDLLAASHLDSQTAVRVENAVWALSTSQKAKGAEGYLHMNGIRNKRLGCCFLQIIASKVGSPSKLLLFCPFWLLLSTLYKVPFQRSGSRLCG